MGKKIWIEVCLISGRGLIRRTSSLWKLQWYAVAWIHPKDKYCTIIDTSGNPNPLWKTRFSTSIEPELELQELAVHVEVYSRDPIFLRESLFGSVTIHLKEFLDKYDSDSHAPTPNPVEEVGSFQLRKRNSNKPLGFVDVSIKISQHRKDHPSSSSLGVDEGFNLNEHGSLQASKNPETSYEMPIPPNYYPPRGGAVVPSYQPPRTPPPPPPSNVGYIPNLFPNYAPSSYINMPSAVAPPVPMRGVGPGFGMGLGAGALAAGAVIFGDDFMPGFDVPAADLQDASVSLATYPPF